MNAAIRIRDLRKSFGKVTALDGLNMDVPEGAVFALVGPNGSGKSTTIKILMNVLRPNSGSAELLGVDSRRVGPAELTRIGYVSENQRMPDWMTVNQFLEYCRFFYPDWDSSEAAHLVSEFQLPADRKLRHLSRGMQMKAALASSLAYRPRLILLDEPFSGLDPLVREEFIEGLIERLSSATVLISSHDLTEVESFATHVAYLDNGRIFLAEELKTLTGRFREIEVAVPESFTMPQQLPTHWVTAKVAPDRIRLVDTEFDKERAEAQVREVFPTATHVSFTPMPLRAIFVALAKRNRKPV